MGAGPVEVTGVRIGDPIVPDQKPPGQTADGSFDVSQMPEWIPVTADGKTIAGYVRSSEAYALPQLDVPATPLTIFGENAQEIGYFGPDSFAVIEVQS